MGKEFKAILLIALLTLTNMILSAQSAEPIPDARYSEKLSMAPAGFAGFSQEGIDLYPYLKNTWKAPAHPGGNPASESLVPGVFEKAGTDVGETRWDQGELRASSAPPVPGTGFQANPFDGIPNDNHLAISEDGYIVSVSNSQVLVYDQFGSLLDQSSLDAFAISALGPNLKFDPRVLYDPGNDRFIVTFLSGRTPSTSKLVIAFSTEADPTEDWNLYVFPGNFSALSVLDYPQIGISNEELFVTANLTDSMGSTSHGSAIWQIGLANAYAGATLSYRTIQTNYFSLLPVSAGEGIHGPEFFFLSNYNIPSTSSETILLHRISNTIDNGGVLEPPVTLLAPITYQVPPNANQKGTSIRLAINDCRVMDAYYKDDRIEFVLNTARNARASIFWGSILLPGGTTSGATISARYIRHDTLELAYPSITWGGCTDPVSGEHSSVIGLNFSSYFHFPGCGAYYIDPNGNVSNMTLVKKGQTYIGASFANPFRWGDYSAVRARSGHPGEVWMVGSFGQGNASHKSATWISQLTTECFLPVTTVESELVSAPEVTVFPNPAPRFVSVRFPVDQSGVYTVDLLDVSGRQIARIIEEFVQKGEAMLKFNVGDLNPGIYFIRVVNPAGDGFTRKVLVAR